MLLRQIAVVSKTNALGASELAAGAAALQRQVARDLALHWSIQATVSSFSTLDQVPVGSWPIVIVNDVGNQRLLGYHTDEHGQPFALVQYGPSWTLAASHEMIEMLIDPFGKTLVPGRSVDPKNPGRVQYLVEACDPCQHPGNAYTVNGFLVSDFYTPRFFDPEASAGVQYSANGKIEKPREILQGGYITWHNLSENAWYQATLAGTLEIKRLGNIKMQGRSLRERIDRIGRSASATSLDPAAGLSNQLQTLPKLYRKSSRARGLRLAIQLRSLLDRH